MKMKNCFSEKLAEAQRKFETLKSELKGDKNYIGASSTNLTGSTSGIGSGGKNNSATTSAVAAASVVAASGENEVSPGERTLTKRLIEKSKKRQVKNKHFRKINDLKLAFSEFYLSLILLQNYQSLNFTGFRKILKKHDKIFKTESGSDWRKANVETAPFYTTKKVDLLITEVENLFTQHLEGGNRQRAMKRLRVPPFEEKVNN